MAVGRRTLVRVHDHHGHTDERIALFIGNRTPDGRLRKGRPDPRQQQEQCPQTRPRRQRISESREKLFHRITFKLSF